MKEYKVIFADLDGTLIETISGETFPKSIWDMKLRFEVLDKIKEIKPEYLLIITQVWHSITSLKQWVILQE